MHECMYACVCVRGYVCVFVCVFVYVTLISGVKHWFVSFTDVSFTVLISFSYVVISDTLKRSCHTSTRRGLPYGAG